MVIDLRDAMAWIQKNTTTKHSEVTMNSGSVKWLADEINRRGPKENNPPQWLKELYEQASEMEVMGKEMSYSDGYREGYKRALELVEWKIQNELK